MKKFIKRFGYAFKGITFSLADQLNMKVHIVAAVIAISAGFFFSITIPHWCAIVLCIAIVLGFEMINTALENLVDLVTLEQRPQAGKVKDIAAGAVLIVSIGAAVVGVLIFSQYL